MADWLDIDAAMAACRIPAADRTKPDVLANVQLASSLACGLVEDGWREQGDEFAGVGPVAATTLSARVTAGATVVPLPFPPLVLSAFTADGGTTVEVSALTVDGLLVRSASGLPAGVLTYQAGYGTPPAWATAAALIIAEHYYRTRLGATRVDTSPGAGAGFMVPNAARAILAPHERTPLGFA